MYQKDINLIKEMKVPVENVVVLSKESEEGRLKFKEFVAFLVDPTQKGVNWDSGKTYTAMILSGRNIGELVAVMVEGDKHMCATIKTFDEQEAYSGDKGRVEYCPNFISETRIEDKQTCSVGEVVKEISLINYRTRICAYENYLVILREKMREMQADIVEDAME